MRKLTNKKATREARGEAGRIACIVASRIYDVMDDQDLSQGDVARKLGISRSAVSRVLGGDCPMTILTMAKFSDALGFFWDLRVMHKRPAKPPSPRQRTI